jgi:hypothetical protein
MLTSFFFFEFSSFNGAYSAIAGQRAPALQRYPEIL